MNAGQRVCARLFDRSGAVEAPQWRDLIAEGRALVRDTSRFRAAMPALSDLPRGDGHTVLVFPAFLGSDYLTQGHRAVLTSLGYQAEGWGAGWNLGPTQRVWNATAERLVRLAGESGQRVSLVGYSLGGVLARALAFEHPDLVRQVVTVCSPFRLPTASPLRPIFEMLSPWHIDPEFVLSRIAAPPPVPTTAIYTPRDGVVAWTSCIDEPAVGRENVAVDGCHSTLLSHPATIRIIAERLARACPGTK